MTWVFQHRQLIGALLMAMTIGVDIITDYRRWLSKRPVRHSLSLFLTGPFIAVSCYLMGWWSVGLLFTTWLLKDAILGTLMARTPLYVGTTAWLDRLQRRNPWVMVFKFVSGVAGLILYICATK